MIARPQIADIGDAEARVGQLLRGDAEPLDPRHETRGADRSLGLGHAHRFGDERRQWHAKIEQAAARLGFEQR